ELVFDKCAEDAEAYIIVLDLQAAPALHPFLHGLEAALCFVEADTDCRLELEVLRVFRKYDVEVSGEAEIAADKDAEADNDGQAELLGMAVADTEGKAGAVHSLVQRENTEEVLAVFRNGVFFTGDADVAEAELFFQAVHDFDVRNDL